jgi:hypothetical protein
MLYSKIKKYLSHNNIDIKDVDSFISIFDNSDNNGAFIKSWNSEKIGISQPTKEQLDNISINEILLDEAKAHKIAELNAFHESDEVRILTINENFKVSTNYETTRKWFNEIINDLENESDITGKPHNEITFEWEISTGVWLPLKLSQLKQFKYAVFNITRVNFKQYRTHTKAIESLTDIKDVESYDFTEGYLLNNKLNFDIYND